MSTNFLLNVSAQYASSDLSQSMLYITLNPLLDNKNLKKGKISFIPSFYYKIFFFTRKQTGVKISIGVGREI